MCAVCSLVHVFAASMQMFVCTHVCTVCGADPKALISNCVDWHGNTHTHAHTHTRTHAHRLTHPLPKPKQWSIIWIHILLWATSVPLLRKNWSQNRLLTVNCRTLSRPLTTRKRPLWTHAFNRPTIRVNGGLVWERSDLSLDLWRCSFLKRGKHNGGFVEAVIVILVLVLFLVIEGELSGMSQLSSGSVCGGWICMCVCLQTWRFLPFLLNGLIKTGWCQTPSDFYWLNKQNKYKWMFGDKKKLDIWLDEFTVFVEALFHEINIVEEESYAYMMYPVCVCAYVWSLSAATTVPLSCLCFTMDVATHTLCPAPPFISVHIMNHLGYYVRLTH